MDTPTFEELEEAIKKLKNNKAPGADGIKSSPIFYMSAFQNTLKEF
jgi:hypothetical protein